MYGVTDQKKKLEEAKKKLVILYDKIPATKGCMENINKDASQGGCAAWCCNYQTPQVLYSEFLNTWDHIRRNFSNAQFMSLIEKCLRKYLFENTEKSCIFFDKSNRICTQHESRPYNCRIYGITPDEEFQPRFERLKVLYPDIRQQCNLVSTVNGEAVTKKDIDNWWLELKSIEMSIGIKQEFITDDSFGSYRTYHDHILLHILGETGLEYLTYMRVSSTPTEKEQAIKNTLKSLKNFLTPADQTKE